MKVEAVVFRQLRRLAPVLDDILNAGELEYSDQAANLAALANVCSLLSQEYARRHPDDTEPYRVPTSCNGNAFPANDI
jgi:hypothetical protein